MAQAPLPLAVSQAPGPITLAHGPTRIPLAPADAKSGEQSSFVARLRSLQQERRFYLELAAPRADTAPGVSYNVYLNLPPQQPPRGTDDPHYLGTFSFFDVAGARQRGISVNVTERLKRLAAAGALGSDVTLTIVPAGDPAPGAAPQVAKIALTAR